MRCVSILVPKQLKASTHNCVAAHHVNICRFKVKGSFGLGKFAFLFLL